MVIIKVAQALCQTHQRTLRSTAASKISEALDYPQDFEITIHTSRLKFAVRQQNVHPVKRTGKNYHLTFRCTLKNRWQQKIINKELQRCIKIFTSSAKVTTG